MCKGKLALVLGLVGAGGLAGGCQKGEAPPPEAATTTQEAAVKQEEGSAPAGAPAAEKLQEQEVTYTAGDTTMKGYLVYNEALEGPRPGVLVVHEWWGHNEYARDRARALAKQGYTALAVDMYGEGKQAEHPEDAQKFSSQVMSNMEVATARFEAARKLLAEHSTTDPQHISAIGYCFGGGVVLTMARQGADLDAVGSFHGMLPTDDPPAKGEVKAAVFVAHGAADPFIPAETAETFKKQMNQSGAEFRFEAYPGAKHAFTNPEATENGKKFNLPLEYNKEADEKSWAAWLEFLKAHST